MPLKLTTEPYVLHFKFNAGTSRGVLREKTSYFLKLHNTENQLVGVGEASPLRGLSVDDHADFPLWLEETAGHISGYPAPRNVAEVMEILSKMDISAPAIRFGLEVALLDLLQGGKQLIFPSDFTKGEHCIPINGLIWMGSMEFMKDQIDEKLQQGYRCLKMKIGALEFGQEIEVLKYIRNKAPQDLVLRVDANGAFTQDEAMSKLHRLAELNLHSIEQPLKPGEVEAMSMLCRQSPVPIALDEELIGISDPEAKKQLLETIKPRYLVLKPTLLGGFQYTREWIDCAESMGIGWWITSALESNIGLNAIAQFTASMPYHGHQGLGTGQLFTNNTPSRQYIREGFLHCNPL